jgi:hypothetical protein
MIVDYALIGLSIVVFYFGIYMILFKKTAKPTEVIKGKTFTLDETPVDTSKEDKIKDKYGL